MLGFPPGLCRVVGNQMLAAMEAGDEARALQLLQDSKPHSPTALAWTKKVSFGTQSFCLREDSQCLPPAIIV